MGGAPLQSAKCEPPCRALFPREQLPLVAAAIYQLGRGDFHQVPILKLTSSGKLSWLSLARKCQIGISLRMKTSLVIGAALISSCSTSVQENRVRNLAPSGCPVTASSSWVRWTSDGLHVAGKVESEGGWRFTFAPEVQVLGTQEVAVTLVPVPVRRRTRRDMIEQRLYGHWSNPGIPVMWVQVRCGRLTLHRTSSSPVDEVPTVPPPPPGASAFQPIRKL